MKNKLCIIFASILFLISTAAHSYNKLTHRTINENIVANQATLPNMKGCLQSLGYTNVNQIVNSDRIVNWFKYAGEQEDSPFLRSVNHFHEPISNHGFSGNWGIGLANDDSAAFWAQLAPERQSPGGAYSWQDARKYFYSALTATDQVTREMQLAQSFRAVGQVMHLVQDMSVPEHVRDTSHITKRTYEDWVEDVAGRDKPLADKYKATFDALLAVPFSPDVSLLRQAGLLPNSPVPIANLFDYEKYNGENPAVTVGNSVGLSEYASANFFSFNTILNGLPHPAQSSAAEYDEVDPISGKSMTFLRRMNGGMPEDHLAQATFFNKYLIIGKTKGYTLANDKVTDYTLKTSFLPNWEHIEYPKDGWRRTEAATLNNATAVRIQTDTDGTFTPPQMYNMRGNLMWGSAGSVYDNSRLPANSKCNWEELPLNNDD